MKNLLIKATKSTPRIDFNAENSVLSMEGDSYPENTSDFFDVVLDWINEYVATNKKKTTINIKLNYFNTSTSKALLDIIDIFEEEYKNGTPVELKWYYKKEYESIQDSGQEFAEDVSFPFNLVPIS